MKIISSRLSLGGVSIKWQLTLCMMPKPTQLFPLNLEEQQLEVLLDCQVLQPFTKSRHSNLREEPHFFYLYSLHYYFGHYSSPTTQSKIRLAQYTVYITVFHYFLHQTLPFTSIINSNNSNNKTMSSLNSDISQQVPFLRKVQYFPTHIN